MPEIDTRFPAWMIQKNWTQSDDVTRTLIAGAQIAQQQAQLQQQQRELMLREATEKLKRNMMQQQAEGTVALGAILDQATQQNAWTSPETRSKVYSLAKQYPWLTGTELFQGALKSFDSADESQRRLDHLIAQHQLNAMDPEPRTADVKNISQLAEWKAQMRDAVAAGRFDEAEQLRQQVLQLETAMTPANTMVESFGPEGQVISRITTGKGGAQAGVAPLTTAATTELQKRLVGFEKANGMSKRLLETLGPLDVGIAGWGQQVIVNEGLAQFFPGLASQSTTDARSLLGTFNETMIKTLKADAQVNQKEEQRILAVLPKPGPNESLPSATSKIIRAMREIHSMSSIDAKRLGQEAPGFPLSADEIKALYKSGKLQDKELAKELLRSYYPEVLQPYQ